jgi:hypothetical protein
MLSGLIFWACQWPQWVVTVADLPGPDVRMLLKAVVDCPKPGHPTLRLFRRCRWWAGR